jgi:hypothetical protein
VANKTTTEEATRPAFVSDNLNIPPYKPSEGEYVFRSSYGENIQTAYDPWAVQTGQATYKYGNAALHPAAAPALKFLEDGPFWVPFSIQPQNDYKKNPEFEAIDNMIIDLIEDQIRLMEYESFRNVLKSIWRDSFIYGFSVAEINFDTSGDYTRILNIKTHSPFHFDFYVDGGNNLTKIYYRLQGQFIEGSIMNEKFIVTTYPYLEHGKFYGTSILQSVYFDIKMIEILERSQAEGLRAFSIRPIIHHYLANDLSKEDLQSIQNKIFNLDAGSLISLPGGQNDKGHIEPTHSINVLEDRASPAGLQLIKDVLDMLYKRVNRRLGLPDDLGFAQTTIGSLAKAKEEFNLYTQTIENNQDFIESFVNRKILPAMVKYNYPALFKNVKYIMPQFRFNTVEEDAMTENLDQITKMVDSGILSVTDEQDRNYIRQKLELPETTKAPEEIIDEMQDSQDAQQPTDEKQGLLKRIFGGRK